MALRLRNLSLSGHRQACFHLVVGNQNGMDGALYLIGRFRTHSTLEARVWTRVNLELQPFAVSLKLERLKVWKKNFIMFGTGTFQAHTIQRLSRADEQSHGILIIIQQIRLGPASSDSS